MKINKIKINNFRSIQNVEMEFEKLMMFIGQNNHGKSNMLYAILFFFGEIKVQELDFFNDSDELFVPLGSGLNIINAPEFVKATLIVSLNELVQFCKDNEKLLTEYKGQKLGEHRLDILVENQVIVELKAVDRVDPILEAQLLSYLRVTGKKVGLLINFNVPVLKRGIKRMIL